MLFKSFDALFGLPRKKSAGVSVTNPVRSGLLFADQQAVDDFVGNYQSKNCDNVCYTVPTKLRHSQRLMSLLVASYCLSCGLTCLCFYVGLQ